MTVAVPAGEQRTEGNCRSAGVAALVGQELDALRCSGPILNFLTTFQYLVLDFPSTFLIFDVSRAQLPLEKVDDFSFFSRGEVLK